MAVSDQAQLQTIVGATTRISERLIGALPPAFLLLVLINVAFLGMVMWFLNNQIAERTRLVSQLLDRCMTIALQSTPPARLQ